MNRTSSDTSAVLSIGLVAFFFADCSLAEPEVLDQFHVLTRYESAVGVGYNIHQRTAQTIQVGMTGQLTRLEFWSHRSSDEQGDLILNILAVNTNDGVPFENSILGQTIIPKEQIAVIPGGPIPTDISPLLVFVDLRPLNLYFQAGTTFAIGFDNTGPIESPSPGRGIGILGDHAPGASGPYAPGQAFIRNDNQNFGMLFPWMAGPDGIDLGFRTFMAVPEPATLTMLTLLALAWVPSRLRSR